MRQIISKKIEDKNIVWFQNSNSYLIFEPLVAKLLTKIHTNANEDLITWFSNNINVPCKESSAFIKNLTLLYHDHQQKILKKHPKITSKNTSVLYSEKHYLIFNHNISIQFETAYLQNKIHPVFAHLEVSKPACEPILYHVFEHNEYFVFNKNKKNIGHWPKHEIHVFEGKLSMQLLIDIYQKPESDWMGVFHASALSNGKESMLLLGNSGQGKSTSLALLHAHGFEYMADDFTPIDNNGNVYTYPAAISIKQKSIIPLLPYFPELKNSQEYQLKNRSKKVRYIPPKKINFNQQLPCKALIFIEYNPNIELEITSISKITAFQQLIPDSWISPSTHNAAIFLDWFILLPCYQLTYANNEKMIETVTSIFNNEL